MKNLCRECHKRWGQSGKHSACSQDKADAFYSGYCEFCGKFIEASIVCYGYDFRKACGPFLVYRYADGHVIGV